MDQDDLKRFIVAKLIDQGWEEKKAKTFVNANPNEAERLVDNVKSLDPLMFCDECGLELPKPEVEDIGNGYTNLITKCPCGKVYQS